uniref:Ubiquitin domain-containing protein 1-like n=1 Tax=Hirondellea gigas TaxID=1518452 RepID=A0A2P2IDY9_9CRUS
MGGCLGTRNNASPSRANSEEPTVASASRVVHTSGVSIGKNVSLRHEKLRWKSDMPLTEKQVRCKREEFWDTAPAFDGRREIWDALKAAAAAVETLDYDLAQAILDGASITLPHGTLTDCYDELGTRYQLPVYCFALPVNVILDRDKSASIQREEEEEDSGGEEVTVRIRLSTTSKDLKMLTRTTLTIAASKQRLQDQEGLGDVRQRWYYGGKLLSDSLRVQECGVPHNHIVQVIITGLDEAF